MKKLIAGTILLGASSMAFAQPGCGVGAMIWKGQSGIAPHVLAATTNGIASQTVSMTLGITGCHTNENVQSMAMIMESRGAAIAADMSRGQGENLEAMAAALEIEAEDRSEFYQVLNGNFNTIFPSSDTTSGEAVDTIVALLEKNESLRRV
ncbi:MAG: DUF3015 family protein [Marinobacter sp.]|uniref:DUF3015 family protein n=1 Tax=Marinobacter sp. TaxID=50741 RepID=UPI003F945B26